MKKTILLALVVALFSSLTLAPSNTNAQEIEYRASAELALPMGDLGDAAGTGFGVTASGEKKLDDKMTVTATVGYIMFGGEEVGPIEFSVSAIPIQAGLKYFFMPKSGDMRFYGMGEAGFHYVMASAEGEINLGFGNTQSFDESDSEIEFSLAPSVGFEMPLSDLTLDVAARYQFVSGDASYFGIRAGVIF
jgi:hypothetical protein